MSRLVSRRAFGLLGIVAITAAIAFPLGVIASHQFSDVPDTNTYHADIDALADAGVTTGCGNGTTYCPGDFVTREQMAAFMNRLGALAAGKAPVVNATKLDGLDSTDFVTTSALYSGTASCAGTNLFPVFPITSYGEIAGSRAGADGHYSCGMIFPNGSVVTSFAGAFFDNLGTEQAFCGLYARDLHDTLASALNLGNTGSTGISETPGAVELTDATIENATIDNAAYAYFADCFLGGDSGNLMVGAVRATYTAP